MMKSALLIFSVALLLAGCVSTTYTKSISVTKDENGKIIQTTEYEGVTQPDQRGWPIEFKHLKGIRPGEK